MENIQNAKEKRKEYLLEIIKAINGADARTLQIIRENPLCNARLIERSSKSTKDPNPLSTTLSTITQKYPISIDVRMAQKYNVPKDLLCVRNDKPVKDSRIHDRVLCKKEAVDWWVCQSNLPDKPTVDLINLIFKPHYKEVTKYYDMEWPIIRVGTPNLEKRSINTRTPLINTDKATRQKAVEAIFFPEYAVLYDPIPTNLLGQLRTIASQEIASNMSLSSQLRIFMNSLDPKTRTLPVPPGFRDEYTSLKHAIIGSNFVCTPSTKSKRCPMSNTHLLLNQVAKIIVSTSKSLKEHPSSITEAIQKTKIEGTPLGILLKDSSLKETPETKVLKAIMGMEVIIETTNDGLTTSPMMARITPIYKSNQGGTMFRMYLGDEVVNFKYSDIRGQFTHNGPFISNITCNFTTTKELKDTIIEIAIYCRWGFADTRSTTYQSMKNEVRKIANKSFLDIIGTNATEFNRVLSSPSSTKQVGCLTLTDHCEYQAILRTKMNIDKDINLIDENTKQKLIIPQSDTRAIILPDEVQSNSKLLINNLSLKQALRVTISYHVKHSEEMIEQINDGNFTVYNEHMVKFLGPSSENLSATARMFCINLVNDPPSVFLLAFYYSWCFASPTLLNKPILETRLSNSQILNLFGLKGIFCKNEDTGEYMLFNNPLDKIGTVDMKSATTGLMYGYKILNNVIEDIPLMPLLSLELEAHNIKDGKVFNTMFEGTKITVVRDSSVTVDVFETIQRQITNYNYRREVKMGQIWAIKRKALEEREKGSLTDIGNKRMRVEEWTDELDMQTEEVGDDEDYGQLDDDSD